MCEERLSGVAVLFLFLGIAVQQIDALACGCGIVPQAQSETSDQCFVGDNLIIPYCSPTQVLKTNTQAIPTLCAGATVGSFNRPCNGWFQYPNANGLTYNVWLCDVTGVSFATCTPEQLVDPDTVDKNGQAFVFAAVQTESTYFSPLWDSDSQCLVALCPEGALDGLTGIVLPNPYLTFRNGTYYSVCEQVSDAQNLCDARTGECTCHIFQDGTQAFTGAACELEKGRGNCCSTTQGELLVVPCCPSNTPPGSCLTTPNLNMCGLPGQTRSPFCVSPDGFSTPSCQAIVNNTLTTNCPQGLGCPGDSNIPLDSVCREAGVEDQPCACQCSLCSPACSGIAQFGVCLPQPYLGCACLIPGAPCVDGSSGDHKCESDGGDCTPSDLCGGVECNVKVNECRTLDTCDSSRPWRLNISHPCICNGNGLCNVTSAECECFNSLGLIGDNPVHSAITRCFALDSCAHCNTNPTLPMASACTQVIAFPSAFNCTCQPYWYTSGSFQNTRGPGSSLTTPVFQCSTGSCIGGYSLRNISTTNSSQFYPWEMMFVNSSGICVCPNGTFLYTDPTTRRAQCAVNGFINPNTSVMCGHNNLNFMEIKYVPAFPAFVALGNTIEYTPDDYNYATLFSVGGPARCTCDGFTNATYPQRGMWYAPTGTYCSTWCVPPQVTFTIAQSGSVTQRTCDNCASYGFLTVLRPGGSTQCGDTLCTHFSTWNQTAGRCECTVYPYVVNFPGNINCSLDWCNPVGTFNGTGCDCPPAFEALAYVPGQIYASGCKSKCQNGGTPNPATGYVNCSCPSTFYTGQFCEIKTCLNGGTITMDGTACICTPIFNGSACETSLCQNGGVPSMDFETCICMFAPLWDGIYCQTSPCSRYSLTQRWPLTPVFTYRAGSLAENQTMVLSGVPISSSECQCAPGFTVVNIGGLDSCGVRQCPADRDIITQLGTSNPQNFQCRCTCPTIYNIITQPSPPGAFVCPRGQTVGGGFTQPSLVDACPGNMPNSTHTGWNSQCVPQFVGINCTTQACAGNFVFNPNRQACVCINNFVGTSCDVCPLTGSPSRIDPTTCLCIGVAQVELVCTNSSCAPDNVACNTPSTRPLNEPPLDTSSPGPSLLWIIIVVIMVLTVIAGISVGIYYGVKQAREKTEAETAERQRLAAEQDETAAATNAAPASGLETTPLVQSDTGPALVAATAAAASDTAVAADIATEPAADITTPSVATEDIELAPPAVPGRSRQRREQKHSDQRHRMRDNVHHSTY